MTIRKSLPSDLDTLVDVWLRSVRASHSFLTEQDIQSFLPSVRVYLALPDIELWVLCTEADKPVGFMGLSGAVVDALFLAPERFRRGEGTRLLDHARSLKGPLSVDVNEQNPDALEFYLARGFTVVSRSPVDADGRPFPLLHLREISGESSENTQQAQGVPHMHAQMILVAGPYRSGTGDDPALIAKNVAAMTDVSLRLFRAGHLPVMGEWFALPLIEHAGSAGIGDTAFTEIFHPISRRLVAKCDACLRLGGASTGADEMVALAKQHGKTVYLSIADIPEATA